MTVTYHQPVLLAETLQWLITDRRGFYIDGTFGGGGHARAIAQCLTAEGVVVGVDWDEAVVQQTCASLKSQPHFGGAVVGSYAELAVLMRQHDWPLATGILLDLGISSLQLADPRYGLSFREDAPLDMRCRTGLARTAADLVNDESAETLEKILREYGEERYARRIARKIVAGRRRGPLRTTQDLAALVVQSYPASARHGRIHVATRTFQALRLAVNEELLQLKEFLLSVTKLLRRGGRVVMIAYHSLEDRIVKHALRAEAALKILTPKPVVADRREVQTNPRARSAKLRVGELL